ncbi:recombination protein RecR [Clostridiales bacterium KA00134]|nr:recombination protein RecR [Clostridiales bacterium KA00134]
MRGPLEELIRQLTKLKGIGAKTAQRLAYDILEADEDKALDLARALVNARKNVKKCSRCRVYTDVDPCNICSSPIRDRSKICVVEYPKDVDAMEKTNSYHGLYFVLYGNISIREGIGPETLGLDKLFDLVREGEVKEVIVATGASIEGDTSAAYIADALKDDDVVVTRIGYGLPYGGDLEYFDPLTIERAMINRQKM